MGRISTLGRVTAAVFLLCSYGGTAEAQTPAQRLAAWSQAIMRRQIDRADVERSAETAKLEAQIRQDEQTQEVLPNTARSPLNAR